MDLEAFLGLYLNGYRASPAVARAPAGNLFFAPDGADLHIGSEPHKADMHPAPKPEPHRPEPSPIAVEEQVDGFDALEELRRLL